MIGTGKSLRRTTDHFTVSTTCLLQPSSTATSLHMLDSCRPRRSGLAPLLWARTEWWKDYYHSM